MVLLVLESTIGFYEFSSEGVEGASLDEDGMFRKRRLVFYKFGEIEKMVVDTGESILNSKSCPFAVEEAVKCNMWVSTVGVPSIFNRIVIFMRTCTDERSLNEHISLS